MGAQKVKHLISPEAAPKPRGCHSFVASGPNPSLPYGTGVHRGGSGREAMETFHELTGISLEVVALGQNMPRFDGNSGLCPVAALHVLTGRGLPPQCGRCIHLQWLSGEGEPLADREYCGPCGCLWAEMCLGAKQPWALVVRGAHPTLGKPALRVLRLITRQLRAEFDAANTRRALNEAEARISLLEAALGAKASPARQCSPHTPRERVTAAIREFAKANLHRPIQLRDAASLLNMNPSYLCNVFSKRTGITFRTYLECLRLEKACELLRDPARRVQEVAFSVGFSSAAHFCRVFKGRTGVSPRAWRERHAPEASR